jgi:TatD DNase family protein
MIDIGANLLDPMFSGIYNGKQAHNPDVEHVLKRATDIGVEKMIITAGYLEECPKTLELAKTSDKLFTTAGVHPTHAKLFDTHGADNYYKALLKHVTDNLSSKKIVALGEMGLDYDRLEYCDKETQMKYFDLQLNMTRECPLPLFLHMRSACTDFVEIISRHRASIKQAVVHSFTGTMEEMKLMTSLPELFIGINGCSLRTDESVEVVKQIPLDRLLLETDAPWCEIRPTHPGSKHIQTKWEVKRKEKWDTNSCVRGRNEPCHLRQVLEVVAAVREMDVAELGKHVHQNTIRAFNLPQ